MKSIKKWLHNAIGRKLFAFLLTSAIVAGNGMIGEPLTSDNIQAIVMATLAYIAAQAVSDAAGKLSNKVEGK